MTRKRKTTAAAPTLSATEAARNFSRLLNRVRYERRAFVIERGGDAVCEIRPVYRHAAFTGADLVRLLATLSDAPEAYLEAVATGIAQQRPTEDTRWPR